jgi:hypothetical protein
VRYEDPLEARERGAVAEFLPGYSGNTFLFIRGAPSGGFCSPVNDPVDGSPWRGDREIEMTPDAAAFVRPR